MAAWRELGELEQVGGGPDRVAGCAVGDPARDRNRAGATGCNPQGGQPARSRDGVGIEKGELRPARAGSPDVACRPGQGSLREAEDPQPGIRPLEVGGGIEP